MASLKTAFATVYLGYIFRYACLIVLIPFYARVLGPSEYGHVLVATALGNVVWAVQNWGFAVAGARNVAASAAQGPLQHEFSRHLTARALLLPLSLLVGGVGIWWSPPLREEPILGLMAVAWGIMSGCNLGWFFQGVQQYRLSITAETINFALTLVLALVLVSWRPEAVMALSALLLANFASLLYSYLKARAFVLLRWSSVKDGVQLLSESLPMFISAATGALMANAGTYILGLLSSPAQAAFYGTTERLVTTGLGLLVPASQVLLPRFSRLVGQSSDAESLMAQQRKAIVWVTAAGGVGFLGALFIGPWLLPWALGDKFGEAARVLQWFSPIFLVAAFNNAVALYVLMPRRKDRWITFSGLGNATISLMLMAAVAGSSGANGIAVVRVCVELLVACLMVVLWRRCNLEARGLLS